MCYKKQCKTVYLKIFGPFSKQCPIKVSVPWGSVPWGLAVVQKNVWVSNRKGEKLVSGKNSQKKVISADEKTIPRIANEKIYKK